MLPTTSMVKGPIDMHVHLVGNGKTGSGCWLKIGGWHRPLAAFMLSHIGMKVSTNSLEFDQAYVELLLRHVRTSSLKAIVLLAHEEVYEANGKKMPGVGSFYVPNDYVLGLARQHPEFIPAISIHPARADALEELNRCVRSGARILKCLPNCHNIDCSDPRYTRFWEAMAEAKLPLLAHTGGEHTVPVVRKELSDPRYLRRPLECGVTVIAAHCATKSGLFDPEYFHIFRKMTEQFENLYGDSSAFNVPIRGRHIRACLEEPFVERILHGSDYPVPVSGRWAWLQGFVRWSDYRKWEKQPNVLERDYQLKKAMGFPERNFCRIEELLRPIEA